MKLKKIISNFSKAKILVIGDLILDEYIWGNVERISPEAPVPVVWADKRTYAPGGAANVANNISSFSAEACLVGVTGQDEYKNILFSELRKRKISAEGIFAAEGRHTTLKTRIIAGHQQVVRVDWEHVHALSAELNKKIISFVKKEINNFDAVIVEDYGKGVINKGLLEELIVLARNSKKIITVDPKEEHFQYYRNVTAITPNRKELENAIRNIRLKDNSNTFKLDNYGLFSDRDVEAAAKQILEYLELDSILVTLSEQGMCLFEKGRVVQRIPTVAQQVFDVSGAGDTVISVFTLALCAGASKSEAAHIANYAAGIVVGKVGTTTTNKEELLDKIIGD